MRKSLVGGDAEVQQQAVDHAATRAGGQPGAAQRVGHRAKVGVHQLGVAALHVWLEPRPGLAQRLRVPVQPDQPTTRWRQRFEQRGRVAAAAQGAICVRARGVCHQPMHDLVKQHGHVVV